MVGDRWIVAQHASLFHRLRGAPAQLEQARARVDAWLRERPGARPYAAAWHELEAQ